MLTHECAHHLILRQIEEIFLNNKVHFRVIEFEGVGAVNAREKSVFVFSGSDVVSIAFPHPQQRLKFSVSATLHDVPLTANAQTHKHKHTNITPTQQQQQQQQQQQPITKRAPQTHIHSHTTPTTSTTTHNNSNKHPQNAANE